MKRSSITLDVKPVETEKLSAAEFLRLAKRDPGMIKSSRVLPPVPGKRGFGTFLVEYSRPLYKAA